MNSNNVRNFCIIAHIDHGKSTLADRFLEITGTVDKRKMKEQYLDQLELERERGITIKMAPVRMTYSHPPLINADPFRLASSEASKKLINADNKSASISQNQHKSAEVEYVLNLIDTPGHSDFSYEVSRALAAVEGAILLVDGAQGIQAQTLANLEMARKANLTIIGAINKIDLFEDESDLMKAIEDLADLLGVSKTDIYKVSAKSGKGVEDLLSGIIDKFPPPRTTGEVSQALIFDSFFESHKGIVASIRVFGGGFDTSQNVFLKAAHTKLKIRELGYFFPELSPQKLLVSGDIGYIATGLKDPDAVRIGDTIVQDLKTHALPGYEEPKPSVFVSFYPVDSDEYEDLGLAFKKLKLNDSALWIENDRNEILGRGYKIGFLGKLHYEITVDRIRQEFGIETTQTFPSVLYKIKTPKGFREITRPEDLPSETLEIHEPIIKMEVILPSRFVSDFSSITHQYRMRDMEMKTIGENVEISVPMPLAELMSDFDDKLKSVTEGFGSFSYKFIGFEKADVLRVDILISGDLIPGLSRFLPKDRYEKEARRMAERLKDLLPRKQYSQPIQVMAGGRIVAREDIRALKKNVTGNLYGGDRTRKMKLWQKQKRGKKKLKEIGGAKISPEVFKELLKK